MTEDHTVSWDGNRWGLLREEVCAGLRGAAVEIERRLDGSHWLRYRGAVPAVKRSDLVLPRQGAEREVRFFDAQQVGQIITRAREPFTTMFALLGMTAYVQARC